MEHRPTLKNYREQITFYGTVYIRHPGCDRLLFILPAYDPAPVLDQTAVLPPSSVPLESTGLSGFTADSSDSSDDEEDSDVEMKDDVKKPAAKTNGTAKATKAEEVSNIETPLCFDE